MYNYLNNFFYNNEPPIGDKTKIISFERLDEQDVINGFTLKPYNFRMGFVSDEEIDNNILMLEDTFKYTFAIRKQPNQTHSNNVKIINLDNLNSDFSDVDGLITNLKGVLLSVVLADCQGILLYDKNKNVAGCIHSGWKGTLHRISSNAIDMMVKHFDCNVNDIQVFITPSILKCCFEVEDDVRNIFINEFKDINIENYISKGNIVDGKQKYFIDTISINKDVFINKGIRNENITLPTLCTKCNKDIMHSHRGDGIHSGRNLAFICIK